MRGSGRLNYTVSNQANVSNDEIEGLVGTSWMYALTV